MAVYKLKQQTSTGKVWRRFVLIIVSLMLLVVLLPLFCYLWITFSSRSYLYDSPRNIPARPVAIVLGTAKYTAPGKINPFYRARIDAAIALYRSGKVRYFIVSGDNRTLSYNEPAQMRSDLMLAGIPPDHIQPDYAGLRTLDSVLRAEKVFGNRQYIVISQPFHNARAVFLARHHGQDVIGLNAADPVAAKYSMKTRVREIGARMKAIWDILSNKQARHYGEPIPFPVLSQNTGENRL